VPQALVYGTLPEFEAEIDLPSAGNPNRSAFVEQFLVLWI
jgi:hypothetical protein